MATILFEYQFFWPLPTIPGTVPEAVQALTQHDDIRAVFDIPWFHLLVDKDAMFLQTGHQRPMIAGHIARRTPVDPAKLTILQDTLDYALLDAARVDIVILHKTWDESNGATSAFIRSRFGQPIYEDDSIALFEVPPPLNAPEFIAVPTQLSAVEDRADSYFYAPEPGWVMLRAQFTAGGRDLALYLDGEQVHHWTIDGEARIELPLPASHAGYHTVTLAVVPPCPQHFNATLVCRAIEVENLELIDFMPAALDMPIQFDRGLQLAGVYLPAVKNEVSVWLWWQFAQPLGLNEIRFVHVLDANGVNVAQVDDTLGDLPVGERVEVVKVPLPDDLPEGEYTVYTGWYTLPDIVRFPVLSDVRGAQDRLVYIGAFTR